MSWNYGAVLQHSRLFILFELLSSKGHLCELYDQIVKGWESKNFEMRSASCLMDKGGFKGAEGSTELIEGTGGSGNTLLLFSEGR